MDNNKCTVYIDEAGDLGIHRGTQWFVLTAVIIDKVAEPSIRASLKSIKTRLNLQKIHFRNVKDFQRKCYIVDSIATQDFTMISVLFDTNQFDKHQLPSDRIAYNFICRYLIERVSWVLRDSNRRGDIILSSRGTSHDQELVDYIQNKLIPFPENQIANVFDSVSAKPASLWDMLQVADVCATSMFYAFEVGGFDFTTPCYSYRLLKHMYAHNGTILSYGIKFFTDSMKPSREYLDSHKICKRK